MTVKDILGHDDFCLMRVGASTSTFACFDCEFVLRRDASGPGAA